MLKLNVNGRNRIVDVEPEMPLLWVLRDQLGLPGRQVRLRHRRLRRLHGPGRRRAGALLRASGVGSGREEDPDHRGPVGEGTAPRPAGVARPRSAPMRLLPHRHHPVGGCAAREEPAAHRPGHRCGDDQPVPLRHLRQGEEGDPRACRGDRRAGGKAKPEENDHDDRLFPSRVPQGLHGRLGRPRARVRLPGVVRGRRRCPRPRSQCLDRHPSRRPRGDPHRPLRDGAGHLHGARAAGGRRARLRLGQGERGVRLAQRAHPAQPHLGLDVHGRQHGRAFVAGLRPQGGRQRTRDAGRGGGCAVESSRRRMHGGERRRQPWPDRPEASLRRGRRRRGQACAAKGSDVARSRPVEDRGQAAASTRPPRQGAGQAGVRRRRRAARDAARVDRAVPGVRRQGRGRRRARGAGHARREEGRPRGELCRRRCRQLVAGERGLEESEDRLGCGRQRRVRQPVDRGDAARGASRGEPAAGAQAGRRAGRIRRRGEGSSRPSTSRRT